MRQLLFVEPSEGALLEAVTAALRDGATRLRFPCANESSQRLIQRLAQTQPQAVVEANDTPLKADDAASAPVVVLCEPDAAALSALLMAYLDARHLTVIAPVTPAHWSRRSLFLISIPKSGTHMLTELVKAFGYDIGGECPPEAVPGHWHFLEFTNSHTAAPDFFIDTVRRQPHGNRAHPFPRHPALFIYRNPLDIVASEAGYYHRDGATAFSGYLDTLGDEERLLRLIDDRWLLGSIRDRMAKFAAWLDFGNVIPVSFEELVGPQGGSDERVQHDLIWSLMLRLHVPGDPANFATKVFNPNSPTFRSGRIGGHERHFTPAAWAKFKKLDQDFMEVFGFHAKPASGPWLSDRALEFRRRAPRYSHADPGAMVYLVRQNFLGFHIFRYRDRFVAQPPDFAYPDLASAPPEVVAQLPSGNTQAAVEFMVQGKIMLDHLAKNRG
jgi:hypothetical protein